MQYKLKDFLRWFLNIFNNTLMQNQNLLTFLINVLDFYKLFNILGNLNLFILLKTFKKIVLIIDNSYFYNE